MSHCEAIGDLPVYARDSSGAVVSFVLTNVRCVPSFKYTLLSVRQMWAEHRIDARFRDLERLELPNGKGNIPYDSAKRLYTITFVSNVMAEARLANSGHSDGRVPILATSPAAKRQCIQRAFVGFHAPTATAHIEKMSAAQASAFWHRRSHHGAGKVRKYADTTKGTPKNVSAAHAQTCPCCAQAHIKTASHSGSLDVTTLEPGTPPRLHGDYVEYQVRPQKLTRSMSPRRMESPHFASAPREPPSTRRRPCVVGPGSERVERARSMDPQFRELVSRASNRPFGPPPTSF